jgi:L-alanine-DL-glutamate epimerase-like enolase superfamily enzyme
MLTKTLVPVSNYALGRVVTQPVLPLQGLTINATGFDAIENRHMSKLIPLLGGKYTETFSSAVSILVYRTASGNRTKLEVAWRSGISVVTEHWLWSTIHKEARADLARHLVRDLRARLHLKNGQQDQEADSQKSINIKEKQTVEQDGHATLKHQATTHFKEIENVSMEINSRRTSKSAPPIHEELKQAHRQAVVNLDQPNEVGPVQDVGDHDERVPLREIPPVSARRNGKETSHQKMQPHILDGQFSIERVELKQAEKLQGLGHSTAVVAAINGALRDILGEQARKKAPVKIAPGKKKGLIGRALSNLSNTSRNSRASSIDSVNTDGIGSELTGVPAADKASEETPTTAEKATFSFTGRANSTLAGLQSAFYGTNDPDLARSGGFQHEQESTPQMTQLGYEDPEEAVLLREKLAASRKTRSSKVAEDAQQVHDDNASNPKAAERKIRDDDLQADANARWGAGRRTRHKQRSPPDKGLEQF